MGGRKKEPEWKRLNINNILRHENLLHPSWLNNQLRHWCLNLWVDGLEIYLRVFDVNQQLPIQSAAKLKPQPTRAQVRLFLFLPRFKFVANN